MLNMNIYKYDKFYLFLDERLEVNQKVENNMNFIQKILLWSKMKTFVENKNP